MQNLKHDLRSPLSGITGMLDLLISDNKNQIEVQTGDLIMIKESAQSLLDLINGTLVVPDAQKSLNESKDIGRILSSVILEINRLYLPMAQNKDVSLSLRSELDKELQLPSNYFVNLIQVIGNLVANAIKFTPSNGSVDTVFTLDTDEEVRNLNITVVDTGKGMSPDQVSAFNQGKPVARSMGTNGEEGFGIGLQHVIQLVSEDDGHIFAKSEKGSGTTFSLSFPLPDKKLSGKEAFNTIIENGFKLLNGNGSQN